MKKIVKKTTLYFGTNIESRFESIYVLLLCSHIKHYTGKSANDFTMPILIYIYIVVYIFLWTFSDLVLFLECILYSSVTPFRET